MCYWPVVVLPLIMSAAFSAIITTGVCVLPDTISLITEASATLKPDIPFTLIMIKKI